MKVSIVTEGFQNTGYGHITRCLSLYQAFEEKNITPTFYVNTDENSAPFLADSNYKVIDWLTHPTRLVNEVINSDILIIDSYLAGREFYEILSKLSRLSLYIDDYIRLDYPKGIVLNGTINAENFSYNKSPENEYLLGAKYIPIRKEFWTSEKRKIKQKISSALITFGGQDVKNLTPQTVKAIQQNFPEVKKYIVMGNGAEVKKEIEKLKGQDTEIFYSINASKMKDIMGACDIAITAAGQTLYELAVTGTPAIAVAVVENQRNNILEWKKSGFLLDPIFHGDHNFIRKITNQIDSMQSGSLRKKLSNVGRSKVDGQGSRRVISYLLAKIAEKESFFVRKAVKEDSELVFNLSNDPDVRMQSIGRDKIEFNEHLNWFGNKISDPGYEFLLAFDAANNFIAQIRFQIENDHSTISISIDKKFRGKGLSSKILKYTCRKVLTERQNIKNIIAYIRQDNFASIKAFESSGFVKLGVEQINSERFLKYILDRNLK